MGHRLEIVGSYEAISDFDVANGQRRAVTEAHEAPQRLPVGQAGSTGLGASDHSARPKTLNLPLVTLPMGKLIRIELRP